MSEPVAIPCPHCGGELYDGTSKYRDETTGKWSACTWCSTCWLCIKTGSGHVHEGDPWEGEELPDYVKDARARVPA